ncbi:MAG: hypothetical protein D6800_08725 [Candidatus Zixiibacteriota bacterium]|nr:MAG: hypothetical protein D6800_08725 [candidate division Zixibacteria bacterium]
MDSPPKLRSDLVSVATEIDGKTVYTVKDPRLGNYFRLREPEHWLIHQFDGRRTPPELADRFREKWGFNLRPEDVNAFINKLDDLFFLENSRSEQELSRTSYRKLQIPSLFGRLLYIRIRAFRPGRWLDRVGALYRPFYNRYVFVL